MDSQLTIQSVPITTNVVILNPPHGEVYSMQHYVIKVSQRLAAGRWFSPCTQVSSTNLTGRHDIAKILLKVVLNTITLTFIRQQYRIAVFILTIKYLVVITVLN